MLSPASQFSSVQFSCSVMSDSLRPHGLQHTRPPCPSPAPGAYSNSCPLSWWCHPTISSSVIPFSCLQSFPASRSFPMSQFFTSGGQTIGVSASTSVLPMNTQDWSPLGWTGWISLQSKGLSRVFSNTTVQKHQFFSAQLSLYSLYFFNFFSARLLLTPMNLMPPPWPAKNGSFLEMGLELQWTQIKHLLLCEARHQEDLTRLFPGVYFHHSKYNRSCTYLPTCWPHLSRVSSMRRSCPLFCSAPVVVLVQCLAPNHKTSGEPWCACILRLPNTHTHIHSLFFLILEVIQ